MGKRTVVLIVVPLLAGLAVFAGWQYLASLEEDLKNEFLLATVYRAVELIPEGTEGSLVLSQGLVEESEELVRYLPDGVLDSPELLTAVLTGRVAGGPISGNSVLTLYQWVDN